MRIGEHIISMAKRAGSTALVTATMVASLGAVTIATAPAAVAAPAASAAQRYVRVRPQRRTYYPQRRTYYPAYRSYQGGGFAQRASQVGYNDGFARGRYDRSIGVRRPNPTGHGAYQNALNGWVRDWGSSGTYRAYYRQSFLRGYWAGYGRR
jgi:hypothetical protein